MKNAITLDLDVKQTGKIKVHTQIINDLSSGIYSSPASCIKELINNSYDADAEKVVIRIKPIQDSITVQDDGSGMNAEDFNNNFAWISKSNKRNDGELSPKLNRPLIGKIGIGFIAVNEICDELEVISSKEGQAIKFTANINFKDYFDKAIEEDSEESGDEDKGIIKGEYTLINEEEDKDTHYTIVRLLGLKDTVKQILDDHLYWAKKLKEENKSVEKSYFKSMHDLLLYHYEQNARSFSKDNGYIQFIIDLASYIPVEYIDGGPIPGVKDKTISEIIDHHASLKFKVDLDGVYLKKPILFNTKDVIFKYQSFRHSLSLENGKEIRFKGYFYMQHGILFPKEFNGISIRIRSIPIAPQFGFDPTFMSYPLYMNQLFRNWISCELYIENGLEDAMNIDRASFRVTHPEYLALQDFLHRYLDDKVFPTTLEFYEGGRNQRKEAKTKEKKKSQLKILGTKKIDYQTVADDESKVVDKKHISGEAEKEEYRAPLTIIKSTSKSSIVEIDESTSKKFKKKDWEYLEDIFLIFEASYNESKGNIELMRKLFYDKISNWKNIQ